MIRTTLLHTIPAERMEEWATLAISFAQIEADAAQHAIARGNVKRVLHYANNAIDFMLLHDWLHTFFCADAAPMPDPPIAAIHDWIALCRSRADYTHKAARAALAAEELPPEMAFATGEAVGLLMSLAEWLTTIIGESLP